MDLIKKQKSKSKRRSIFSKKLGYNNLLSTASYSPKKRFTRLPEKLPLRSYCVDDLENDNNNCPMVPVVIRAAISELERRNASGTMHIYKKVGNKIKVRDLNEILYNEEVDFDYARRQIVKVRDNAVVTSFIKGFFCERLIEPLLGYTSLNYIIKLLLD